MLALIIVLVVIPFLLAFVLLKKPWWLTFITSICVPAAFIYMVVESAIATDGIGPDVPFYGLLYTIYVPSFCLSCIFMRWLIFFLELNKIGSEEDV